MATLRTKLERYLRKGNEKCTIYFGSNYTLSTMYKIDFDTKIYRCTFSIYSREATCRSISELGIICPGILETEVEYQSERYGNPVFYVKYDGEKFNKNKWRWLVNTKTKYLDKRISETEGIKRDIYVLGKEIVSFCNAPNKEKALAIDNLFSCYDESDYTALQTMMYMLKHPEVKKAKITYAYGASEFWVGLGHTKHYLKKANDYCIEL